MNRSHRGSPAPACPMQKKGEAVMKSHPPAQKSSPSVSRSPLSARTAVLLHAALAACALLAACANTVNNHGGAVGSGGSASSGGTNTIQTTGGGTSGSGGTAPEIVLGADAESYPVAERSDYAAATGSSTAGSSGSGYITVTPLPDILYTETQSGIPATWTSYEVTITIQGTPFTLSFTKGDTAAKVIENVPTGSTVSARARISVQSTTPTAGLGYSELTASSASSTTTAGSNTIMMWVQYPVEFVGDEDGSVTVPAAGTYSNGGGNPALALPDPAETGDSIFAGWALSPDGPAAFEPGSAIPAGSYRGKLTLYPLILPQIPAFSIAVSSSDLPSRSGGTDAEGNAITIYTVREAYITGGEDGTEHKTLTFTATAAAGTSFPDGTTFAWKVGTTSLPATMAGATVSPKLSEAGISSPGAAAASPTVTEYTVTCTAQYDGTERAADQVTLRISPPIKITSATIREASSGGVWFQASSASGAAGTFDHLTVTGADTAENNAAKYLYCWLYFTSALPSGLAAADITVNWYLGSNSSPTVPTILNPPYGRVELLASVPRTVDRGALKISIADLRPRMQAYNIVLYQMTSSNLNYEASDVVASLSKFNNELRYNW